MWTSLNIQWFRKNPLAIWICIRQMLTTALATRWWMLPHVICLNWRRKSHPHIREKIRVHRLNMANVKCLYHCRLHSNLKLSWAIARWSPFIVSSKTLLGEFWVLSWILFPERFFGSSWWGSRPTSSKVLFVCEIRNKQNHKILQLENREDNYFDMWASKRVDRRKKSTTWWSHWSCFTNNTSEGRER